MRDTVARRLDRLLIVLGVIFALYHMVMVFGVFQESLEHYTNHLAGAVLIAALAALSASLKEPGRRGVSRWLRPSLLGLFLVLGTLAMAYIRLGLDRLEALFTFLEPVDMAIGAMLLVAILGITWAAWGAVVTIVVTAAILYFFFGQHIPGPLGHLGFDPTYVMSYLGMGLTAGLFKWVPLSADTIFLFMVLGALINRIGVHVLFIELGKVIGNLVRGGVAFPAVIGSALIGTVTGNSIGNVILTGSVTIPLMKRFGYPASSAAAIEAVASSGGQIMPPIMGLGVFIMAAFLNIPYIDAALRGTIPAILYFIGVGIGVFFLTRSRGIPHTAMSVDWRVMGRLGIVFVIPFTILILLLLWRYSPNYAAFFSIVSMIGLASLQGRRRPAVRDLLVGLGEGGIMGAQLAVLVVAAGALAQTVEITNFSEVAYHLLANTLIGSSTLVALLVAMVFLVLLGTGMPTAIAYVLGAITLAPLLQNLGLDRFAVHFFIFYFAVFANNTPPVALNVSAAAKIGGAPFWATAKEAMILSAPAFFLPFVFVYNPALLEFPRLSWSLVVPTLVTLPATFCLAVAIFGFFLKKLGALPRSFFAIAVGLGLLYVALVETLWLIAFASALAFAVLWVALGHRRQLAPARVATGEPGLDPHPAQNGRDEG